MRRNLHLSIKFRCRNLNPTLQHFLNLEKCTCGAYRYLAIREHKKSYEIYLIHQRHFSNGQDVRKYFKLASIAKFRINIHDPRFAQQRPGKTIRLNQEEASILKSLLRQLEALPGPTEEVETLPEFRGVLEQKDEEPVEQDPLMTAESILTTGKRVVDT
jgi:hypothetical protein